MYQRLQESLLVGFIFLIGIYSPLFQSLPYMASKITLLKQDYTCNFLLKLGDFYHFQDKLLSLFLPWLLQREW